MKQAVGYVRVSTEEQSQGWSLDSQEQQIREYAKRNDFGLLRIYKDESSGTKERRPGFDSLIEDAQAGKFDAIIIIHTSRLFRNIGLARRYKDELRNKLGVDVLFVNQPIMDPSDPTAFIMEGINELFDEYYIHQLRFWTKLGKQTRARRGLWNGTLPFGYSKNKEGVPIPHPENAEGLRLAFEAYSSGSFSDRQIAELLNRKGYKTTGNWGRRSFTKDTVNRLLKNKFYLGYTKYKNELFAGAHEALIEEELFEKCKLIRAGRRGRARAIGQKKRIYLFSGLARCSECGLTLRCQSTKSKGKWRYYRHSARVRGYYCSAPGKMIRADKLEAKWSEIISGIMLPDNWKKRIEELAGDANEREAILEERNVVAERLRRLARLYQDLLVDDDEYRTSRIILQSRLETLIVPNNPQLIKAGKYLERIGDLWDQASMEEQRDITRIMIGSIIVNVINEKIVGIEPVNSFRLLLDELCGEIGVELLN